MEAYCKSHPLSFSQTRTLVCWRAHKGRCLFSIKEEQVECLKLLLMPLPLLQRPPSPLYTESPAIQAALKLSKEWSMTLNS